MNKHERRRQEEAMRAATQRLQQQVPQNKMKHDLKRFHPLGENVLLEVELETETESGIIIPDMAQLGHAGAAAVLEQNGSASVLKANGLPIGRCVEVGPDAKHAKVGDRFLCSLNDVSKIDVLIWLVPESKLKCRVDPKPQN